MPQRRTRTGVEIARVGTHALSTGDHTFTREQLAAAMANAATQAPVLGIGHTDPRFVVAGQDGDPAFGRATNLRLEEDGDVLLGDFEGVPEWLDESMEIAYPRRSLEGLCSGDDLRISCVKLLGTTLPGIKGLADLPAALAASAAEGGSVEEQARRQTHLLIASASLDQMREAYSTQANEGIDENADWEKRAWVREVRVDSDVLIVEQQQTLYSVPWTANADGTFTFGGRTEVAVQYVDVAAASGDAAVFIAPVTPANPPKREESVVDPKTLREQLGLAEDASEDDVTTKLTELAARPETIDGLLTEEQVAERIETAKTEEREAVAASAPTAEHIAAMAADAAAGREAKATLDKQDRDGYIAAAVGKGKFAPAVATSYRSQLDKGGDIEKSTREFIDSLPDNTVPVSEIGASTGADDGDTVTTTGWFPSLQEA